MTNEEILTHLKSGGVCHFGCHGRNREVIEFIADLEKQGLVETRDASLSQETRREVWWVGDKP